MAKLCPNCTRLNGNQSATCKSCGTTLVRAPIVAAPTLLNPAVLMGLVVAVLLVVGLLYFLVGPLLVRDNGIL
jgi:uncharacterized paraquat-inducible protein A